MSEHRELESMVKAGMTPMQVIVAATSRPAEYLKLEKMGALAPGKEANFLVLDANPLDDITNTQRIHDIREGHRGRPPRARSIFDEGAMNHQFAVFVGAAAVAIAAQAGSNRGFRRERDLQGIWTNATVTPLERPAEFAGKAFLTEAEAAAYQKRARERNDADRRDGDAEADLATGYNDLFWERGRSVVSTRRTSLVVDPQTGEFRR